MFFRTGNKEGKKAASCSLPELWQIFLPAIAFVILYTMLQYGCHLFFQSLALSGKLFFGTFVRERPGLCMTLEIVIPMALSLLLVSGEGRRRMTSFRRERSCRGQGITGRTGALLRVLLFLCTCFLCILGNAQIQAMGLNSDSVSAMQPVYNEIPFPFLLLIFAGFTPFAEEFVFRGLVYTGLRKHFSTSVSVLTAAACFGLYHGELIQGAYAFCMGLIFSISMEPAGDIRMPWLLHGLANGLPLCLSYFGLWDSFAGPAGRACALVCLLISAGSYWAFSARERK